jgi:hypothetical protein
MFASVSSSYRSRIPHGKQVTSNNFASKIHPSITISNPNYLKSYIQGLNRLLLKTIAHTHYKIIIGQISVHKSNNAKPTQATFSITNKENAPAPTYQMFNTSPVDAL